MNRKLSLNLSPLRVLNRCGTTTTSGSRTTDAFRISLEGGGVGEETGLGWGEIVSAVCGDYSDEWETGCTGEDWTGGAEIGGEVGGAPGVGLGYWAGPGAGHFGHFGAGYGLD